MRITERTINDTYNSRREILSNNDYRDYLKGDYWRRLKIKALKKKRFRRCRKKSCLNTVVELHHTSYKRMFTKDELKDIIPLCRNHHQLIHDISKKTGLSVKLSTNMVIYNRNEIYINQI